MLPRQRVTEVWSWLPAFRAVAELEHVQKAAKELHVTASSLSRAVRLLEAHVGKRLFDRVGRNVRLNDDGAALLRAVGEAMRGVDDGIARVTGTVFAGELRVACDGDQPVALAWRAASRVMARHPSVTVDIVDATADVRERLLRGEIDVAVLTDARADARLRIERIARVTYGIYCGPRHPLFGKRNPTIETMTKYPFVGPTSISRDQWPDHLSRIISLRVPALAAAVAACEAGGVLAVLPDDAATPSLRRLPSDEIAATSLYAVRRRPIGVARDDDKSSAFVSELRAEVTARRDPPRRAEGRSRRQGR